jgi:Mn2+/Fe2+ NRAMP family transporter
MRIVERVQMMGPGLVFALGSIGARDLISNSVAGSLVGLGMVWVLVLAVGARYVLLDASARYVLFTGETLLSGCSRLGRWPVIGMFTASLIRRHVSALTKVLLLGTAAHVVMPLPTEYSVAIWGVGSWCLGFVLLYWGRYVWVERVSRPMAAVLGLSLGAIAILSMPDLGRMVASLMPKAYPTDPGVKSQAVVVMAVLAAAIGSFSNLSYPAYVHEKGWRSKEAAAQQKLDLRVSIFLLFSMLVLVQVAAAGVLESRGLRVEKVEDLTAIYTEVLGAPGRILFGVALWCAAFSSYISNGAGQGIMLADIYHRLIGKATEPKGDPKSAVELPAYRWSILFMFCSPVYVFFTGWTPMGLVLVYGLVSVLTLPIMASVILFLTCSRARMGEAANGWVTNLILVATIVCAAALSWQGAVDLFHESR